MARRTKTDIRNRDLPVAPSEVAAALARKFARMGREDAKKYKNLMDFTRTHAIMFIDKRPSQGQTKVNIWYEREAEPILSGNVRIHVTLQQLEHELDRAVKRVDTTGRAQRRTAGEVDRLEREIMNFEAQLRTNIQRGFALRRKAEDAMTSWKTYREEGVTIYTRARAIATGIDVSSVRAEIPEFEPIELKFIPEFEDDTAEESMPPKGPASPRRRGDEETLAGARR